MHTGGSDKQPTVRRHPFVQIVNPMDLHGGQANMQVVLQEGWEGMPGRADAAEWL